MKKPTKQEERFIYALIEYVICDSPYTLRESIYPKLVDIEKLPNSFFKKFNKSNKINSQLFFHAKEYTGREMYHLSPIFSFSDYSGAHRYANNLDQGIILPLDKSKIDFERSIHIPKFMKYYEDFITEISDMVRTRIEHENETIIQRPKELPFLDFKIS
jgi:hypothetical protein